MQIIALEFEPDRILVAAARQVGKQLQIQSAFSFTVPVDDQQKTAELLKEELTKRGLQRAVAIVVVKRANVEIREINLPPAPDNELPEMVKFIARNEFAALTDSWLLDFVPTTTIATAPRKVLASGLSPERHRKISAIMDAAGIKVRNIVLRPFESLGLMQASLSDGDCSLVVDLDIEHVDMIVSIGKQVIATRTVRVAHDSENRCKQIYLEVKRTAASVSDALSGREMKSVIIIGDTQDDEPLVELIRQQMGVAVRLVKPFEVAGVPKDFEIPAEPARYSALLGSLMLQASESRHAIDFLNPRRPIIKRDGRKKALLYGGLAAVILLGLTLFGFLTLRSQKSEIAELQATLERVQKRNKGDKDNTGVEQITSEVRTIDQWMFGQLNWLDELARMSDSLATPDDTITDLFDGKLRDGFPDINVRGRMVEKVRRDLIDSLEERQYRVSAKWDPIDEDPNYPRPFDLRINGTVDSETLLENLNQIAEARFQNRLLQNVPTQPDSNDSQAELEADAVPAAPESSSPKSSPPEIPTDISAET